MRERTPKSVRSVLHSTEVPAETAQLPVSVPGRSPEQENTAGIDRLLTDFLTDLNRLSDAIGTSPGAPNSETDPTAGSPENFPPVLAEPRLFERDGTSEQLKMLHDLHSEELSMTDAVPPELPGREPASSAPSKGFKHPDPELDRTLDQLERKQSKILPSPSGSAVMGKQKKTPGKKPKSGTEGAQGNPGKALQANPEDGPYQELRPILSTRTRRPRLRMVVTILCSALLLFFLYRQLSGLRSGPTAKALPPAANPQSSGAVRASATSEIDSPQEAGREKVTPSIAEPRGTVSTERIIPNKSRPTRTAAENRESAPRPAIAANNLNNLPQQIPGSAGQSPASLPTVSAVTSSATVPDPAPSPQKPDTGAAPSVVVLPETQGVPAPPAYGGSIPNPSAETGTTKEPPPSEAKKTLPAVEKNEQPSRPFVPPVPAKAIEKVSPLYPASLKSFRMNASVVLEADVDENGKVTSVRTVTGLKMLRYEAEQAVKKWKFSPATIDGVRVRSTVQVTVNFKN
jgi:TonB family protein